MAILKMINVKEAGRKKFKTTLDYISNPQKSGKEMVKVVEKAERFEKRTWVNRRLYGMENCKRQYKQMVVSLATCWFSDPGRRKIQEEALETVKCEYELYFGKLGYETCAYVHCNTQHPHFHLLIETLNVITGKQLSQSVQDLVALKDFGSAVLRDAGLNEEILTSDIYEVSEEDFWESEEQEMLQDIPEMENYDAEAERNAWNIGTDGTSDSQKIQNKAEIKKQFPVDDICTPKKAKRAENPMLKTMCYKADEQREMCRIVQPILKEMCHMAYPELKEMCHTVSAEQDNKGKKKEMCVIVK